MLKYEKWCFETKFIFWPLNSDRLCPVLVNINLDLYSTNKRSNLESIVHCMYSAVSNLAHQFTILRNVTKIFAPNLYLPVFMMHTRFFKD